MNAVIACALLFWIFVCLMVAGEAWRNYRNKRKRERFERQMAHWGFHD